MGILLLNPLAFKTLLGERINYLLMAILYFLSIISYGIAVVPPLLSSRILTLCFSFGFEVAYDILSSKKDETICKIDYEKIKLLKWSIPSLLTHKQKITKKEYEIYKNYLIASRYYRQNRRF